MFIPFQNLADTSRLWIYGSENKLTERQQKLISIRLTSFLNNWEYHQKKLRASFKILEKHFIIVGLDDSDYGVGGCSMDELQRLIQSLEKELSLTLMNRLNIYLSR